MYCGRWRRFGELPHPAMTGHWSFFSKPAVEPVRIPESGHWIGDARFFGIEGQLCSGNRPLALAGWISAPGQLQPLTVTFDK